MYTSSHRIPITPEALREIQRSKRANFITSTFSKSKVKALFKADRRDQLAPLMKLSSLYRCLLYRLFNLPKGE